MKVDVLMTTWTSDELNNIGNAEELQIASLQSDGTLRSLVTIWVVRLGDGLCFRAHLFDQCIPIADLQAL